MRAGDRSAEPVFGERWRVVVVLTVGAGCLLLHGSMRAGYLPNPILSYVSTATLLSFLVVPMATLALLGLSPLTGLTLGCWRPILPVFLLGALAVIPMAVGMARMAEFQSAYGITVNRSLIISTLTGMLCLEYFFRGFLILPIFGTLGWYAVALAAVPYAVVHLGKPLPEILGSVPFAIALSYLAIRSGSILYGLALHWMLAIAVNLALSGAWPA